MAGVDGYSGMMRFRFPIRRYSRRHLLRWPPPAEFCLLPVRDVKRGFYPSNSLSAEKSASQLLIQHSACIVLRRSGQCGPPARRRRCCFAASTLTPSARGVSSFTDEAMYCAAQFRPVRAACASTPLLLGCVDADSLFARSQQFLDEALDSAAQVWSVWAACASTPLLRLLRRR